MKTEIMAILMLVTPFIGALMVPLINLFARRTVPVFAVLVGLTASVFAILIPFNMNGFNGFSFEWLTGMVRTGFIFDPLSLMPALIATLIGFLVLVYSLGYMKHEENLSRYYCLTLLFIGSMVGMSLADNFISLFFFWEVMGVCSYLLIGFFYKDPKAANAGIKAFITTKIGDIGLLASILILYRVTGSFNITENLGAAARIGMPLLSIIAFGFIIGAVGKSAQVPLHVWLPDAMEAPTTISALIHAATMVNAGVYLLARVYPILSLVPSSLVAVQWIGALTAILGAFLAVFNYDLKRILAYSTISQLGYMIFAVGVGGIFASQFHLFSHAIFKALLFLCAGAVIHELGSRDIRDMGSLGRKMPVTGVSFTIGALALMGIPFLNGFFSKDLILENAISNNSWATLSIAAAAALMTAFYSIRTTYIVFWNKKEHSRHASEAPLSMTFPLVLLSAGTLTSWLLVGRISAAWKNNRLTEEVFNWKELIMETFSSRAFIISAAAVILGIAVFALRKPAGKFLREKIPVLFRATTAGLGFDIFYSYLIKFIYMLGAVIRYFIEDVIMEGTNKLVSLALESSSRGLRRMQTGDIHVNLFYIILTLIVLLGIVLW